MPGIRFVAGAVPAASSSTRSGRIDELHLAVGIGLALAGHELELAEPDACTRRRSGP